MTASVPTEISRKQVDNVCSRSRVRNQGRTGMQLLAAAVRDANERAARAAQVPDVEHILSGGDVRRLRDLIIDPPGRKKNEGNDAR